MGPIVDPVESDRALPAKAAVVVIGGGIIGTSAALALAKRGIEVVLCEKGQIAGEQSSRNGAGSASRAATAVKCR
jgi:glycine/D-amino acid oxidase-like deaminating enzyme